MQAQLRDMPALVGPRIFVDDATPEALSSLLATHQSLVILTDESAAIRNVLGHYSDGKANLDLVLKAYTGSPCTVDRKGTEPERLDRPLLTITVAVQPRVLTDFVGHPLARERGLAARFAYALAPSLVGSRSSTPRRVANEVIEGWSATVNKLASLRSADNAFSRKNSVSIVSGSRAKTLSLSTEAEARLRRFQDCIEARIGPDGDLQCIVDWANRTPGLAVRITGLLHLCDHDHGELVSLPTMERGIRIAEYYLAHAVVALTMSDATVRKAIDYVQRRNAPTVTLREVQRRVLGGRQTSDDALKLCSTLTSMGVLRKDASTHPTRRVYAVNPNILTPITEPALRADREDDGDASA